MNCTVVCACKVARHEHGTRNMYLIHKCRGEVCRAAATRYEKSRRLDRLYGREADRVDAQPVREHVEFLRVNGVSYRALASASGVSKSAIMAMIYGRGERGHDPYGRVLTSTAEKILAVKPSMDIMSAGRPIDATGTRRRVQALVTLGWSVSSLAVRLGVSPSNFHVLLQRDQVTVKTALKVRELYTELWDKPNQASSWQDLSAATRARNYARFHGWLPPMAWDDDQIDDPAYSPVVNLQNVSKVDAKREAFLEEAEFFADSGETIDRLATGLGVTVESMEKRFERFDRLDLLRRLRFNGKAAA
ncbi:hypothetical protein [Glutamicibacter sp. AOP5-A2-18]|uniref:hypothetical protein n=1 Tax=Glutamicibacter sp. AOP5-A2-18 TaxID=3457656 RepID=UPI0040336EE1